MAVHLCTGGSGGRRKHEAAAIGGDGAMDRLLEIMARLRAPAGCPWDREQTLESLKKYLIEESYEVIDAIESGDVAAHEEELGDLLLQIVFQTQIRREQGSSDSTTWPGGLRRNSCGGTRTSSAASRRRRRRGSSATGIGSSREKGRRPALGVERRAAASPGPPARAAGAVARGARGL